MNFSEKLTNLRKQKGLSQEELGEKLNVTRQTISKWELGQTTPDMAKLTEIANLFEVSVNDLTSEEELAQNESKKENKNEGGSRKEVKTGIVVLVIVLVSLLAIGIFFMVKFLAFGKSIFNTGKGIKDKAEQVFTGVLDKMDQQLENTESGLNSVEERVNGILNGVSKEGKEEIQKEIDELYESLIPLKAKVNEEFHANGLSEEYYRIENEIRKIEDKISDLEWKIW